MTAASTWSRTTDTAMPDDHSAHLRSAPRSDAAPAEIFRIVGIGVGPGALNSLRSFFRMLPSRTGIAFVIVPHPCDPDTYSTLPRLVAREASVPVTEVTAPTPVVPDHVYIASAAVVLDVIDAASTLVPSTCQTTTAVPIDDLYRSLAQHLGPAAVGVLLSGTDGDGEAGLQTIRERGGDTFTERDRTLDGGGEDAPVVDSMTDVTANAVEIAARLTSLARSPLGARSTSEGWVAEEISSLAATVRTATGLDLQCYKRSTLDRRVARRMLVCDARTLSEYLEIVRDDPDEAFSLHHEILIPVTRFFRDSEVFSAISSEVLFDISKAVAPEGHLRVWVPGCSTGEEVYSLAILFLEHFEDVGEHRRLTVFGTDVSERALAHARRGLYPKSIEADVSAERLSRFFEVDGDDYRVGAELRESSAFSRHDITHDAPLTNMQLVSMRNLLIYLCKDAQRYALASTFDSLESGGFLVLGTAETPGALEGLFEIVDKGARIYRRNDGGSARHVGA